jgi:hypothetical protein
MPTRTKKIEPPYEKLTPTLLPADSMGSGELRLLWQFLKRAADLYRPVTIPARMSQVSSLAGSGRFSTPGEKQPLTPVGVPPACAFLQSILNTFLYRHWDCLLEQPRTGSKQATNM